MRDTLWYWLTGLVPLVMVGALALVAYFRPAWMLALWEYIK